MMAADGKWKEEAAFSAKGEGKGVWLMASAVLAAKCAPVVSDVSVPGTYPDP